MECFCKCFAPKAAIAGSRAVRAVAYGDRARYLFRWMDAHAEKKAKLDKLRRALASMANVPLKKGLLQWHATWEAGRRAKELMMAAVRGIINSKVRKLYTRWLEMVEEKHELARKLAQARAQFTPEGRGMKKFIRQLVWIKRRKEAMKKACSSFVLAGCRLALHKMHAQMEQLRKLRKGGNAIRNRKARMCWNKWSDVAAAVKRSREKMAMAARMMTPEGRMMRHGFGKWLELMDQIQQMRQGLAGFMMGSQKRAFQAWIELTFVGFHLQSGTQDFNRWRMRRSIRLWLSRARVRRGLRKQVWKCALKGGQAELDKLLDLIGESDANDIAQAILARDSEGSTPLIMASIKGFTEVAETLIGAVQDIVSSGKGVLTQADLAAMVNAADSDGNSPLHWAARKGHEAVTVMLIESGALVDFINKEESTPMHWAARKHHGAIIELLLHAHASSLIENKWGATALDNATANAPKGSAPDRTVTLLSAAAKEEKPKGFVFDPVQQRQRQQKIARLAGEQPAQGQQQQQQQPKGQQPKGQQQPQTQTQPPGAKATATPPGAAKSGGTSTPPKPKDTIHEPMLSNAHAKLPRSQKAKAAKMRETANQRREAALKAVAHQEEAKATDLKLRRERAALELRLKDLCDAVVPIADDAMKAKIGDTHLKTRGASPPKKGTTDALREALDAAAALGGCNAALLGEAQSKLMQAMELRARHTAEKKSHKPERKAGEKSEEEKLAQMEKKLLRQQKRGR